MLNALVTATSSILGQLDTSGAQPMDAYQEYPTELNTAAGGRNRRRSGAARGNPGRHRTDERRMHVRAYNYWVSLLEGRDFPSIEISNRASSVTRKPQRLARLHRWPRKPATTVRRRCNPPGCALEDSIGTIAEVPSRSLLSRLTDH